MRGGAKFGGGSVTSNRDSSLTTRRSIHSAIHEPGRRPTRTRAAKFPGSRQSLSDKHGTGKGDSSHVSTGSIEASNQAQCDGVTLTGEHDGNRLGCRLSYLRRRVAREGD